MELCVAHLPRPRLVWSNFLRTGDGEMYVNFGPEAELVTKIYTFLFENRLYLGIHPDLCTITTIIRTTLASG